MVMSQRSDIDREDGLDPADRPRVLGLIFKHHGRENLRPTVPVAVPIRRSRTGRVELWEVIAWMPLTSEFLVWRRDVDGDNRLKAKELAADGRRLDGIPIEFSEEWTDEPVEYLREAPSMGETDTPPKSRKAALRDLILGLTDPNGEQPQRQSRRTLNP